MREERLSGPDGVLVRPDGEPVAAMLVLSGSSGRVQTDRCRVLAGHGIAAMSVRWFGEGAPTPTLAEVPVESFRPAIDRLTGLAPRVGVMGVSFGAVAALLLGVVDDRLDLVVGLAPSHLVWAAPVLDDEDRPVPRSAFSWHGDPLFHQPQIDQTTWTGPPFGTLREAYEASLRRWPALTERARIAVEQITAEVVLSAGGDDAVWPSAAFADEIRGRRAAHGLTTTVCYEPDAGHRAVLPGEALVGSVADYAYGGTDDADRRLGERVLDATLAALAPHARPN